MSERAHLLLPLASSVIYVVGALLVRRAADLGVGVWRTTFVSNVVSGLCFLPLLALGGSDRPWSEAWQPGLIALLLVFGQVTGFLALARGEVTVATPVMGMKPVMVAALTPVLLGLAVPTRLWWAAGLSAAGIGFLHLAGGRRQGRMGYSVGFGLLAAAAFATFDVLIQKWGPAWGAGRLLPLVMGLGAILSFGLIPLFREPLWRIPKPAWQPLMGGALCIAAQGLLLITGVALFGDATAVNVVYSLRSLWIIVAVWSIGHWFHSGEQVLGSKVLGGRLAGAALMTVAVVLAVI